MNSTEIISIRQLPIIEEKLHELKAEIEARTGSALALECTEDTVKEVKKVRADLRKEFDDFEARRKFVKSQIEEPYNRFNLIYKDCVVNVYKKADDELKSKISAVEKERKKQKQEKVQRFAEELKTSYALNWLDIERVVPNITLSASESSLIQKVSEMLEKIDSDVKCINAMPEETKAEVFVEYQKSLNLAQAQIIVSNRHKEIEQAKIQAETQKQVQEQKQEIEQKVNAEVPVIEPPIVEPSVISEKTYRMSFTVVGTLPQLKELKNFMIERGIKYE